MYPYGIRNTRACNTCALTGKQVGSGDVTVSVSGTDAYFCVASRAYGELTAALRAEIEAWIRADLKPTKSQKAADVKSAALGDDDNGS